jgi:hypothetical protein
MQIYRFISGITLAALLGACGGGSWHPTNNSSAVSSSISSISSININGISRFQEPGPA